MGNALATMRRQLTLERREELERALGLPSFAIDGLEPGFATGDDLRRLRVGFSGDGAPPSEAWAFPEYNGRRELVGFSFRARDGRKGASSGDVGARRGLIVPSSLALSRGTVLVVEGASDVAALAAVGLHAIGRPSNAAGAKDLAELLRDRAADVVVLGENDWREKDGRELWPGRDGAEKIASELAQAWHTRVRWSLPPAGHKDARDVVRAAVQGGLDLDNREAREALGRELVAKLEASAEWAEPPRGAEPLTWLPFPTDVLPPTLRGAVREMSTLSGADDGAIAPWTLATLSGAIGTSHVVSPRIGYVQPSALWAVVLMPSGSGKSHALALATAELDKRDAELRKDSEEAWQDFTRRKRGQASNSRAQRAALTAARRREKIADGRATAAVRQLNTAVARLAKCDDDKARDELEAQVAALKAEADAEQAAATAAREAVAAVEKDGRDDMPAAPEEPPPRLCAMVSDTTLEALLFALRSNPRGLTMRIDEVSALLRSLGEYKAGGGGSDQERLLRMRDGQRVTIDRLRPNPDGSPGSFAIDPAQVAIVGAGTLGAFFEKAQKLGAFVSGLLARFWLTSPPTKPRAWATLEGFQTPHLERHRAVERRLSQLVLNQQATAIGLTPSALALWAPFVDELRHAVDELPEGPVRAFRSKLEGDTLRIALVLHLYRREDSDAKLEDPDRVDAATLAAAITIATWLAHEFERVVSRARRSETPEESARGTLVAWIAKRGGSVTPSELLASGPRAIRPKNVAAAMTLLAELERAGLGSLHFEAAPRTGGHSRRVFRLAAPEPGSSRPPSEAEKGPSASTSSTSNVEHDSTQHGTPLPRAAELTDDERERWNEAAARREFEGGMAREDAEREAWRDIGREPPECAA